MDKPTESAGRIRPALFFAVSFGLFLLLVLIGICLALPRLAPQFVFEHSPFMQQRLVAARDYAADDSIFHEFLKTNWDEESEWLRECLLHKRHNVRVMTVCEIVRRRGLTPRLRDVCMESLRRYMDVETFSCLYALRRPGGRELEEFARRFKPEELLMVNEFWNCDVIQQSIKEGEWSSVERAQARKIEEMDLHLLQVFLQDLNNTSLVNPVLRYLERHYSSFMSHSVPIEIRNNWERGLLKIPSDLNTIKMLHSLLISVHEEELSKLYLELPADHWLWERLQDGVKASASSRGFEYRNFARVLCRLMMDQVPLSKEHVVLMVDLASTVGTSHWKSLNESSFIKIYQSVTELQQEKLLNALNVSRHQELYLRLCDLDADAYRKSDFHSSSICMRSSSDSQEEQLRLQKMLSFVWLDLASEETEPERVEIALRALGKMSISSFDGQTIIPINGSKLPILIKRINMGTTKWAKHHLLALFREGMYDFEQAKNALLENMGQHIEDDVRSAALYGSFLRIVLQRQNSAMDRVKTQFGGIHGE